MDNYYQNENHFLLDLKLTQEEPYLEKLLLNWNQGPNNVQFEANVFTSTKTFNIGWTGRKPFQGKSTDEVLCGLKIFLGDLYPSRFLLGGNVEVNADRLTRSWLGEMETEQELFQFMKETVKRQSNVLPKTPSTTQSEGPGFFHPLDRRMSLSPQLDRYPKGRGLIILCCNQTFNKKGLTFRTGAEKDRESLQGLFKGHTVMPLVNFSLAKLQHFIQHDVKNELSRRKKNYRFLIFYLGSHGGQKEIKFDQPSRKPATPSTPSSEYPLSQRRVGATPVPRSSSTEKDASSIEVHRDISISVNFAYDVDGTPIFPKEDIFNQFSAMNFNGYLEGTPMLFLMAFCRGAHHNMTETDGEPFKSSPEQSASISDVSNLPLPVINKADKLIYFATVDGHVSYRDKDKGTWIVQEFVRSVQECPDECFSSILAKANYTMSKKCFDGTDKKAFQMPLIRHTLRKNFLFTSEKELKAIKSKEREEREERRNTATIKSEN